MKRLFALLLCGTLMVPPGLAAPAADWPQWAEEALSWGRDASISRDLLAVPGKTVTRGMAAQLLYEAAGRPAVSGAYPFSDVSGEYSSAVTWAAGEGCLSGAGDGTFAPDRPVTRQEFAAILWRQAGSPDTAAQGALPVPGRGERGRVGPGAGALVPPGGGDVGAGCGPDGPPQGPSPRRRPW